VAHRDPLDWIFVRNVIADRGRVVDVRTRASDHFPLEATISVAAPYQLGGR
jgi:endonuclease/exonuclease/phosphatase family metal-dependent hydrolase